MVALLHGKQRIFIEHGKLKIDLTYAKISPFIPSPPVAITTINPDHDLLKPSPPMRHCYGK